MRNKGEKMKKTNFLLSVMVLGGIVSTAAPVSFADEVGTGNEAIAQSTVSTYENQIAGTETQESALETQNSSTISTTEATAVESSEITEATGSAVEETAPESEEQSTEATEATKATETVENQLDDGEVLVHTTQTDLSQFEVSIASRFARSSSNTQQQFIDSVAPSARTLASQNDLYASVMIAQAIVESGWGKSQLASAPNYNLFGIKGSYNGQSVTFPTAEFVNGQWITVNAAFRKYPSYKQSLEDNVHILKTTSFQSGVYYYSGAWKSNTKSYKDATVWLTGRYATAPNYATTLNSVIETYNLTQYDSQPQVPTSPMYRLYNPNTGEHLYSLNEGEKNSLPKIGWKYEGVAWLAPNSGTKVYRMYNPNSGDHHYTAAQSEINFLKKLGWRYEGLSFYSGGSKAILRLFNPNEQTGTHHYTMSTKERDYLVKLGWRYEGIGFYGN